MLMAALWWRFQRRWPPHVALLQRRMPAWHRSLPLVGDNVVATVPLCSPRAGGGGGCCVVSTARVRCGSGAAGPWQGEQVLVVAYLAGVHTTVSRCASRRRRSESVGDEGKPARMPCHEDQAPYASTASAPNVSTTRCTKRGPRTSGGDRARSTSGARDAPHSRRSARTCAAAAPRSARAGPRADRRRFQRALDDSCLLLRCCRHLRCPSRCCCSSCRAMQFRRR
jgi:hypothetical protein